MYFFSKKAKAKAKAQEEEQQQQEEEKMKSKIENGRPKFEAGNRKGPVLRRASFNIAMGNIGNGKQQQEEGKMKSKIENAAPPTFEASNWKGPVLRRASSNIAIANIGNGKEGFKMCALPRRAVAVRNESSPPPWPKRFKPNTALVWPSNNNTNTSVSVVEKEEEEKEGQGEEIHDFFRKRQKYSQDDISTGQSGINRRMRSIIVSGLVQVHQMFDSRGETLFLAVKLMDTFLGKQILKTSNHLQLVGVTSILLASKYEDKQPGIYVDDCLTIFKNAYTREQVSRMEELMLDKLEYDLTLPTPPIFLNYYLHVDVGGDSDSKLHHLAFYLIEMCLLHYEFSINWEPSLVAAAAIYLARHTLQRMPAWTRQLQYHAHYHEMQLKSCAAIILRYHRLAENTDLKSVYNKYSHPKFQSVAKLPPAISLPASHRLS